MPDINMTMTTAQAVSMNLTGGGAVTAARVAAVGAVMDTDFTAADEVMVGTGAGTHQQVTLGASELLGKKATGAVTNVTGADARTILGLGTAAVASTGVAVGNVPVLGDIGGGVAGLPAVDGSLLTGLSAGGATTGNLVLISEATSDGSDTVLAIDGIGYSLYRDYVLRISNAAQYENAGAVFKMIFRKSGSPYTASDPRGRLMWARHTTSTTFTGDTLDVQGPRLTFRTYNNSTVRVMGEVRFSLIDGQQTPFWGWTCSAYTDQGQDGFVLFGGHHTYTGNPDGIQIQAAGYAFIAGSKIQLFGVVA